MVEWKWMCLRDFSIADVCFFQPINEMLIGSTFQIYRHQKLNQRKSTVDLVSHIHISYSLQMVIEYSLQRISLLFNQYYHI